MTQTDDPIVTCVFCGAKLTLSAAMDAGWEPGYFTTPDCREYVANPVCESCTGMRLGFNGQDEPHLKAAE